MSRRAPESRCAENHLFRRFSASPLSPYQLPSDRSGFARHETYLNLDKVSRRLKFDSQRSSFTVLIGITRLDGVPHVNDI